MINLDGVDPAELRGIIHDLNTLAEYAKLRISAVEAREEGRIPDAIYIEKIMENLYKQVSPEFKW
jgi:hypothetical protein